MKKPTMLSFLSFSANAQQVTVLNSIEKFFLNEDDFLVLKGAAGTGKTSIMKGVVDFLVSQEKSVQLLAPMGRSAKAISNKTQTTAKTIHNCIYKPSTDTENAVVNLIRRVNYITQKQVFIIDESSMLSNKLTDNENFVSQNPLLTDLIDFIKQGNLYNKIIGSVTKCMLLLCGVFKPYVSLYKAIVHIIFFRKTDCFTT